MHTYCTILYRTHQPGCTDICFINCYNFTINDLLKGGCSHGRANDYFQESILGLPGGQADRQEEY